MTSETTIPPAPAPIQGDAAEAVAPIHDVPVVAWRWHWGRDVLVQGFIFWVLGSHPPHGLGRGCAVEPLVRQSDHLAAVEKLTKADLDAMPLPDGEPIPGKTYRSDGWVYRDLPNLTVKSFDELITLVGAENIVFLTLATRRWPDGQTTKRGQCLVSPAGLEALSAWSLNQEQINGD